MSIPVRANNVLQILTMSHCRGDLTNAARGTVNVFDTVESSVNKRIPLSLTSLQNHFLFKNSCQKLHHNWE